jgi:uncharacterized protein (DUF952 family)
VIYHLTQRDSWLEALSRGEYRAESLASAGFIHFSQRHQVLGVANAFYTGQSNLVLLVVDPSRLKAELKYEAPVHPSASASAPPSTDLFPHLYGPLNADAVVAAVDFPAGADGKFTLPAGVGDE